MLAVLLGAAACAVASAQPLRPVEVAQGLDHPWSLAFLPDGRMLVTERAGRLRIVGRDGRLSAPVAGLPAIAAGGQCGLLDVLPDPKFEENALVYWSFAEPGEGGNSTAVARGRLQEGGLADVQLLFRQLPKVASAQHCGSRLVFARDGRLFVTLGDRFSRKDEAQNPANHIGKIVRIEADGRVPADNPFIGKPGVAPEIWSLGHRNVQGAALHPETGELWESEHGPQGGDEINRTLGGRNYGWPEITYGREYVTGRKIGAGSEREDVAAPVLQWTPSIAPSGMAFYTGDAFPQWQGNLFVGALKFQLLARLVLDGERVVREERLLEGLGRIRDVRQGPDGRLWLLDESAGRVLRIDPQ